MKYALVTGSTAGIGLAIGKKLMGEGCFVFLNYAHSEERAEEAAADLRKTGDAFAIIRADLSDLTGVELLAGRVREACPQLEYLVLNSYTTDKTDFLDVTREQWDCVINTNVTVPFFLMQKLFTHMADGGSVVALGAVMGLVPHGISVSYGVSKAALHMLCKSMVKVYAPKGITVNAICPGFVDTPYQQGKAPDHRTRIEDKIALGRFGTTEEVAGLCWSVLNNGYVNGAVIPVDGGYDMK